MMVFNSPIRPLRTSSTAWRYIKAGALLGAELEGDAVFVDGFAHRLAVGDREGERFLAVHVLAAARGLGGDERMPALAGGDEHSVDIGAREEFAVIVVSARRRYRHSGC